MTDRSVDVILPVLNEAEALPDLLRRFPPGFHPIVVDNTAFRNATGFEYQYDAHEIMRGTPAIRNLIREDKVAQMYSAIQTGSGVGMQTMDQCLTDLVAKRLVTREAAREKAKIPDNF